MPNPNDVLIDKRKLEGHSPLPSECTTVTYGRPLKKIQSPTSGVLKDNNDICNEISNFAGG